MITNLLAIVAICFTTNVVTHYPQHLVADPAPPGCENDLVYRGHYVDDDNPQWKNVVTTISKVTEYRTAVGVMSQTQEISSVTKHFELKTTWEETTNVFSVSPFQQFYFGQNVTNGCINTNWLDVISNSFGEGRLTNSFFERMTGRTVVYPLITIRF